MAAEEAGVTLVNRVQLNIDQVRGDPVKLRQIFTNLISNAIKFTHRDGMVVIEAGRDSVGGVTVVVRDTGIGMTEEELMVALTPFGQVDGSRTRWREGTGLGLPIAQSLVSLHGGKMKIRSIKGKGTEVMVALPSQYQVSLADGRDMVFGGT